MNSRLIIFIFCFVTASFAVEADLLDHDEITALLDRFRTEPLNINSATADDIYGLPYISETDAELIYLKIEEKGGINSLDELAEERLISPDDAEMLKECVIFRERAEDVRSAYYSARFVRRLEVSRAYEEDVYLGNRNRLGQKAFVRGGKIGVNVLIEKEPGEYGYADNFKGNFIYSADRYRLILGSFRPASYTGMLQKEGFTLDPYSFATSKDYHDFARPSVSADDYSGYNGAAAYYELGKNRLTLYGGAKSISAALDGESNIESVNLYAYTRTAAEAERYHNSEHITAGAALEGKAAGVRYAASAVTERFSRDISEDSGLEENEAAEVSLQTGAGDWSFRSDAAFDYDRFNIKLNARRRTGELTAGFYYGYIQKDKFCLSSPGMFLGDGDDEHVFGMELKMKLNEGMFFITDNLLFRDLKEGSSSTGAFFTAGLNIKFSNIVMEPHYSSKFTQDTDGDFFSEREETRQFRMMVKYSGKRITTSSVISYSDSGNGSYGYLTGSGLTYKNDAVKIRIGGDIYYTKEGTTVYSAVADTGIYASLASFSGKGSRSYFMISYNYKLAEISAGISRHVSEDSETSGTGYDLIDSDTVHDFELNVKITI